MSLTPLLLTISSNRANICSFAPTSQESQSTRKKLIMMMMFSFNHLFMDNSSLSHLQRIMKWLLISDDVTEASFHQCWDEDKALITFKRITLMAFSLFVKAFAFFFSNLTTGLILLDYLTWFVSSAWIIKRRKHYCFPPSSPRFESQLRWDFFSLLLSLRTVLRSNPSSAMQWISQVQLAVTSKAKH